MDDFIEKNQKNVKGGLSQLFDLFESIPLNNWKREGNVYTSIAKYSNGKEYFCSIEVSSNNFSKLERSVLSNVSLKLDNPDFYNGDYVLKMKLYDIIRNSGESTLVLKLHLMNPLNKSGNYRPLDIYYKILKANNN